MEEQEKQLVVDGNPFEDLTPDAMIKMIAAGSVEELFEKVGETLGEEAVERIQAMFEQYNITQESLTVQPAHWDLVEQFRGLISTFMARVRTRNTLHNVRVMSLYAWEANMAALRELRQEELDFSNDEDVEHVLSHCVDAMFAMVIIGEAFRINWDEIKDKFFEETPAIVRACPHADSSRQLMAFELGIKDSWDPGIVIESLAVDLAGMAGLLHDRIGELDDDVFANTWEDTLKMSYTFPHWEAE